MSQACKSERIDLLVHQACQTKSQVVALLSIDSDCNVDNSITYAELAGRASRISFTLRKTFSVSPEEVIAVGGEDDSQTSVAVSKTTINWLTASLGIFMSGGCSMLVHGRNNLREVTMVGARILIWLDGPMSPETSRSLGPHITIVSFEDLIEDCSSESMDQCHDIAGFHAAWYSFQSDKDSGSCRRICEHRNVSDYILHRWDDVKIRKFFEDDLKEDAPTGTVMLIPTSLDEVRET
eukprot:749938-Hanusia_phi.AAC.1